MALILQYTILFIWRRVQRISRRSWNSQRQLSGEEIDNAVEKKTDLFCSRFIYTTSLSKDKASALRMRVDLTGYLIANIQICEHVYVSVKEHYLLHIGTNCQVILTHPPSPINPVASPCSFLTWCRCTFVTNVVNFWFVAWGSGFHMQASVLIILE